MDDLDVVWDIFTEAFPPDLRRSFDEQKGLLDHLNYKLVPKYGNGRSPVGFISLWDFEKFVFVEHFAVKKGLRGRGYGRRIMKDLLMHSGKSIVLEVEKPATNIDARRIKFYNGLGFRLNQYKYQQPSYWAGGKPVELLLMSYPIALSEKDFRYVRETLYTKVYETDASIA